MHKFPKSGEGKRDKKALTFLSVVLEFLRHSDPTFPRCIRFGILRHIKRRKVGRRA